MSKPHLLSAAQLEKLEKDGFLIVEDFFSPEELLPVLNGAEASTSVQLSLLTHELENKSIIIAYGKIKPYYYILENKLEIDEFRNCWIT